MKAASREEAALADAVRESITVMTGVSPRPAPPIWPMVMLWLVGMGAIAFAGVCLLVQAAHALT